MPLAVVSGQRGKWGRRSSGCRKSSSYDQAPCATLMSNRAAPERRPRRSEEVHAIGDDLATVAGDAFAILPARIMEAAGDRNDITPFAGHSAPAKAGKASDLMELAFLGRVAGGFVDVGFAVLELTRSVATISVVTLLRISGSSATRPVKVTMFMVISSWFRRPVRRCLRPATCSYASHRSMAEENPGRTPARAAAQRQHGRSVWVVVRGCPVAGGINKAIRSAASGIWDRHESDYGQGQGLI